MECEKDTELTWKGGAKWRQARSCSMQEVLRREEESRLPSWQGRRSSCSSRPAASATRWPDPPQVQPNRSCVSDSVSLLKVNRSLQYIGTKVQYCTGT